MQITVNVNGEDYTRDVGNRDCCWCTSCATTCGLTGTHWGCDTSNCGVCTVWLDETPVKSCTVLAVMADGHRVRTVEGLANGAELDPVQQGFVACHGLQCGFCTPGMMLTARCAARPQPGSDPRRRSARRSPASCAGAPDTRTSSVRSAGPPSTRPPTTTAAASVERGGGRATDHRVAGDPDRLRPDAPQGGRALHPRHGQLRRRRAAARHAARRDPAQPVRPRPDRLDRHQGRRGAPEGQGRHHRRRAGDARPGVDADAVLRHAGRAGHRQGPLPGPGGRVRGRRGPLLGPRRARAHRRRVRGAAGRVRRPQGARRRTPR